MDELSEHPRIGKGKPEPLSGYRSGQWSRRINYRHRMVYEIQDTVVKVYVLSSYGHYDDK
ncbi:MAG: Txe/YoeB family addiction module toxin [Bacteroidales bacterium]|nr:Txe/YoeB family addiction module toxin [Bacteroidales bacterium]